MSKRKTIDVVGAIISDGGRYLVGQRPADKAQGGLWEFMGGKIEPGETPEQALARECREELDLEIMNERIVDDVVHEYPEKTIRLTLLACEPVPGSVPKALEHQSIRWVTPDEMRAMPFCPADAELLDRLFVEMPPRAPSEMLSACIVEVRRLVEKFARPKFTFKGSCSALLCEDDMQDICGAAVEEPLRERRGARRARRALDEMPDFRPRDRRPPDLHAATLSFPARLLTLVKEKCGGKAPVAYKRSGVSRQTYSNIVSYDDSEVSKRTAMLFCIGLQLTMGESELLMKSAGYAFSNTLPEDRVFTWCIENGVWNLEDIDGILAECDLPRLSIRN